MNFAEAQDYFFRRGFYKDGGCYKTVFYSLGSEYVFKLIPKENFAYKEEDIIKRETDGFAQGMEEFRPTLYFKGEGKDFVLLVEEKVLPRTRMPWRTLQSQKRADRYDCQFRKQRRKVFKIINKSFQRSLLDIHQGNWGVDKSGKVVIFDGL